jgi:sugar phosphate isomerase/epimerase
MMNRREFIAVAAAAATTPAVRGFAAGAEATRSGLKFGVQLYQVRELIAATPTAEGLGWILGQISKIGFASVEGFPAVYTYPAKELRRMVADHGLTIPSGHFDFASLDEKIEYAAEVGMEHMICPFTPQEYWGTAEGFARAAHRFNEVAAKAKAAGLKFGYHNHNYEFRKLPAVNGVVEDAFTVYMREFSADVTVELDVFWAVAGGADPVALLEKYPERIRLIHMKDRKAGAKSSEMPGGDGAQFTEMGKGTIDWKAVLGLAKQHGIRQYFMDQDGHSIPVMESLAVSWEYLKNLAI